MRVLTSVRLHGHVTDSPVSDSIGSGRMTSDCYLIDPGSAATRGERTTTSFSLALVRRSIRHHFINVVEGHDDRIILKGAD